MDKKNKNKSIVYIIASLIIILAILGYSIYQSNKLTNKVYEFQGKVNTLSKNYSKLNNLYDSEKKINRELNSLSKIQKKENKILVSTITKKQKELIYVRRRIIQKNNELKKINRVIKEKDSEITEIKVQNEKRIEDIKKEIEETKKVFIVKNKTIDSLTVVVKQQQNLKTTNVTINTFENKIFNGNSKILDANIINQVRVSIKLNDTIKVNNKLRVDLYNNDVKYTRFSYVEKMKEGRVWDFDFKIKENKKFSSGILFAKVFCDRILIGDTHLQLD